MIQITENQATLSTWPPTTESPYGDSRMAERKPGNFYTLRDEAHPAYDLYRALIAQGWTADGEHGRHWVTLTKGDRYVTYSLFGQGSFQCKNEHGEYGIGLEDYENVWSDALPHIVKFMRVMSDERAAMMERAAAT